MKKKVIFTEEDNTYNQPITQTHMSPAQGSPLDTEEKTQQRADDAYQQGLQDGKKQQEEEQMQDRSPPASHMQTLDKRLDAREKNKFGDKTYKTRQLQNDMHYTSTMKKRNEESPSEAKEKVSSTSTRSENVLLKIKTIFPFDLFPNTLIIDANKVTIVDAIFFASETVTSILLEEMTDVVVQSNFFLARLVITYSHHPLRPKSYAVPNLRKKEALKAAEIIQGLLVLRISEGIDLSKLHPEDIIKELRNIGKTHEPLPAL